MDTLAPPLAPGSVAPEPGRSSRRSVLVPAPTIDPASAASPVADDLIVRLLSYMRHQSQGQNQELLIRHAFAFAYEAHKNQRRDSGEPYIDHPVEVARILLDMQLDADSVAAALLHDVVEDNKNVLIEHVEQLFGPSVARLVDGVTKLSALEARNKEEAQAGSYRKMFIAMAEDPRVVLVKLADRLHNMRTIDAIANPERRQRIARETLEIYAPLAHRLGIGQIKWELEDRAFAVLQPEKFAEISEQVSQRRETRIQQVIGRLMPALERENIKAEITGRPKHIYSIYRKMERKGIHLNQIYDQLAVRVIVEHNEVSECYRVLGIVHQLWSPIPGQFDDYIARPKESTYRSIHTTVLIGNRQSQPCEIQIRTREMHIQAEHGIAAHWRYKENDRSSRSRNDRAEKNAYEQKLEWLRGLLQWKTDLTDAREFVDAVKRDELDERVYVFTPQGDVIDLPLGSTPIDFAYRIHSELGHSCVGAKVNNKIVPLEYQLQNGQIIDIMKTRSGRGPSRDWLNFVKTSGARNHIKRFFKRLSREENSSAGRTLLEKELRRLSITMPFDEIVNITSVRTIDDLFAQIGSGDITARAVAQKIMSHLVREQDQQLTALPPAPPLSSRSVSTGIQVRGEGDLATKIARCCNPVIGEAIVGYVTRGRGVTVHRADCRTILNISEEDRPRLIPVEWGSQSKEQAYLVPIQIESWDRVGLWRDISGLIADDGINIDRVEQVQSHRHGRTVLSATLRITSVAQLTQIIDKLNRLPDVIEARRETNSGKRTEN